MQDEAILPLADRDVLGRSLEVASVEAFLDAPERLPRGMVLEGEAGIGKTTLWQLAVATARVRGYAVLEARPARAEANLVFAGLGDLLGDVYTHVAQRLLGPQQRALGSALLVDLEPGAAPDQRTVGVAVLMTLRLLAQDRPLLIAVDDEQWLDSASAETIGFALRRLRSERVGLLLARRPATRPGAYFDLDTRLPTEQISLGPISIGALHAIVVERFGTVLARPRLRRLHEMSRGNPFVAIELVRADNSGQLQLDTPELAAADLDRLLGARLDALPRATRSALLAAAASSRPTLDLVGRVAQADAGPLLAPAVEAGIVELTDAEIRFSHPLLASAAYGAPGADERRRMHASLAALADDPQERARHAALAALEPDETVAADVERAAEATFRRGAPAAAAELAALAVRMTPPAQQVGHQRRTAMQAEYLFESGDTSAAAELLDRLIPVVPSGSAKAAVLALQARVRHFGDDVETGVALNRRALAEAGRDDRLLAGIHEGLAWGLLLMRHELPEAARHARSSVRAARRVGDDIALAEGLAVEALTSLAIGAPIPGAMERALELEPALIDLRVLRHPSYAHAYALACTDRLDAAALVFTELLARAEERGDDSALPPILVQLSMIEILAGSWAAADEHARSGYALALQTGQRPSQAALMSRSALLAVHRGVLGGAENLGEQALALASGTDELDAALKRAPTGGGEMAVWALGAAALAAGRYEEAYRYLGSLADTLLGAGMREPGELRFLADAVEALIGLERIDDAAALVSEMDAMAHQSRRQTALGIASRCRALVATGRNDAGAALTAAEQAVVLLDGGQLPLELARALLVLGVLQRRARQKRAARETLTAAIAAFDLLGAAAWAAQARSEASRIGGRAASGGVLTPTESRVAELVTDGQSNKEVATSLGIAPKTVELHLSHIYAKLALGSRTELVRHMTSNSSAAGAGKD